MPVGQMLRSMNHCELTYWLVLQAMDPAGEQRADLRHAIGTSAFVNTQLTRKQDKTTPERFLAGKWLREAYEKRSGATRKPRWDARKFWRNLLKTTGGN